MEDDQKKVEIEGWETWNSRVSYWHIRQILEHKPKNANFAYAQLLSWTKLKLDRYGNKRYQDRYDYLLKTEKEFVQLFSELLEKKW